MPAPAPAFRPRFFHNGYVCRDLDRAIERLAGSTGAVSFFIMDVAQGRPANEVPMRRLALAALGDTFVELIEASGDAPSIYRDAVPQDDSIVFHHTGFYIDSAEDWQALERNVEAQGGAASAGEIPGVLRFLYVDRRADIGHFIEYVQVEEGGRALFAGVPANSLALRLAASE